MLILFGLMAGCLGGFVGGKLAKEFGLLGVIIATPVCFGIGVAFAELYKYLYQ